MQISTYLSGGAPDVRVTAAWEARANIEAIEC
jgi:hypothetical protein